MASPGEAQGFYCSTSGTYFSDKESLAEHYKSDFHRYNLKRKVAGLPPVTREWFEARKAQLSTASATPHQRIWYDPLTKKKFGSQNTYQVHVNSKKYQELVRASGQPAPAPIIMIKQLEQPAAPDAAAAAANGATAPPAKPGSAGFTVKAPHRSSHAAAAAAPAAADGDDEEDEQSDASADTDESGWETASEDEEAAAAAAAASSKPGRRSLVAKRHPAASAADAEADGEASGSDDEPPAEEDWQEWDVCVSLFDNKRSGSMQENLEYMLKNFGFYLPDAEALTDPAGLLRYLGAKLQYGKVPLYTAGDDAAARQFRSLHAVQRHMVDTNQCKLLFEGNEEEYADFYDFAAAAADGDDEEDGSRQLALATAGLGGLALAGPAGFELALSGEGGSSGGGKALGSRELARYYRQRPKPIDSRQSVAVNSIVARYRALGIETGEAKRVEGGLKRAQKEKDRQQRQWLNLAMRANINHNLPKNVPY